MISVILCGGSGSRLWPLSRDLHPKPFLELPSGRSLLEEAYLCAVGVPRIEGLVTVVNKELYFKAAETFRMVGARLPATYILEPFGRNTAPAVAAAALEVSRIHGPETCLLILSADHLIADREAFFRAIAHARKLAEKDRLVTFGIRPTGAETGYGYIEADGNTVLRFIEKPPLEKAEKYSRADNYYWNAGIFCFKARAILDEMGKYVPDLLAAVEAGMLIARNTDKNRIELHAETFASVPDISIDYAIMEKSDRVSVVPCDIGWRDIGSWKAMGELLDSDVDGNHARGQVLLHDTRNCVIHSEDRLVCTIGVENLVIIDTPDALLVTDVSRTQEVRHVYNELKEKKHDVHKIHRTVYRPWGTYTVLNEGSNFKSKRIEVRSGERLSLQMHYHRSEHWIVVSGVARVTCGDRAFLLHTNESAYIPAGQKHSLENPGKFPLVLIEVQSGQYFGEDDIIRFEDSYGRLAEAETPMVSQTL